MDTRLLKSILVLKGYKAQDIAESLNINRATFYRKLEHKSEFTRWEIKRLSEILELSPAEIINVFFK